MPILASVFPIRTCGRRPQASREEQVLHEHSALQRPAQTLGKLCKNELVKGSNATAVDFRARHIWTRSA